MIAVRSLLVALGFFGSCLLAIAVDGEESPRGLVKAAIKAHGGADNIKKTLCGNVQAKATLELGPGLGAMIAWEENYEVPRRYRRKIEGEVSGMSLQMEYAITEGNGWIRQNGQVRDHKEDKAGASKSWLTVLGNLSDSLTAPGVELRLAGTEKVDGQPAKKVIASGGAFQGGSTFFLDDKTHRLVKLMRRGPNPVTTKEGDSEFRLGDFKEVAGVVFPHRFVIVSDGKKIVDLEITRVDFPKTLDDKLFAKPE